MKDFTIKLVQRAIDAGALEEFLDMLIDNTKKYPEVPKDKLIANAAYYSVEKLRKAEVEQASIED